MQMVTGADSAGQSSAAALDWQSHAPLRPGWRSPGAGTRAAAPPSLACRSTVLVPPALRRAERDPGQETEATGQPAAGRPASWSPRARPVSCSLGKTSWRRWIGYPIHTAQQGNGNQRDRMTALFIPLRTRKQATQVVAKSPGRGTPG